MPITAALFASRLERERQRAGEHHGDLVGAAHAVAVQVDRAVGLAVGAQAGRVGVLAPGARSRSCRPCGTGSAASREAASSPWRNTPGGHLVRRRARTPRPIASSSAAHAAAAPIQRFAASKDLEQHEAERDVDQRARDQRALQAEQRQADVHREHHAGDRAERVGGVDLADRGFAGAAAQQRAGDERQRHAGAERRRQHDQRGDRLAREVEEAGSPSRVRARPFISASMSPKVRS